MCAVVEMCGVYDLFKKRPDKYTLYVPVLGCVNVVTQKKNWIVGVTLCCNVIAYDLTVFLFDVRQGSE